MPLPTPSPDAGDDDHLAVDRVHVAHARRTCSARTCGVAVDAMLTGSVIVTGGGSGIGRATAHARRSRGRGGRGASTGTQTNAEETVTMIGDAGAGVRLPVRRRRRRAGRGTRSRRSVSELGRVTGVVTAAGIFHGPDLQPAHEVTVDDFVHGAPGEPRRHVLR